MKYLATPYSKFEGGLEAAFCAAAQVAASLIRAGECVYSPICHTHPIAIYGGLDPLDHALWLEFDRAMMDRCDSLLVAMLLGWDESKGIRYEIEYFKAAGKPVVYITP